MRCDRELPDLRVHRLDLRVQIDRIPSELATEPRLLVAAKRRHRIDLAVGVDPDRAGFELARDTEGAIDILGPYRRCESVVGVVALHDDVVLVLELYRGSDRSKDFLARDFHLIVHA